MITKHLFHHAVIVCSLCIAFPWTTTTAQADEPAAEFVQALRDNGYFDIAIEYLQQMQNSDLVSDDFKIRIQFELAEVYIDQADTLRDVDRIEASLDKADQLLSDFAASQPPPQLFAESAQARAKALFARGKVALYRSQDDRATAEEKRNAIELARTAFNQSLDVFAESRDVQASLIQNFRIDPADPLSNEKREELRKEYVRIRFMSPAIKEQIADTYGESEMRRNELLGEAVAEYNELVEKYSRYSQGSYSRVAAARCLKKMKEYDQALTLLIELLSDTIPRSMKLDVAEIALECWEQKTPPGYQDICGRIGELLQTASVRELRDPRLARLQLGFSQAAEKYAQQLEAGPGANELRRDIDRLRSDAAKFAGNVARSESPLRDQARELLQTWKVSVADPVIENAGQPTTLVDARNLAVTLIDNAIDLQRTLSSLDADDPSTPQRREELQAAMAQQTEQALQALDIATDLITAETTREDINSVLVRRGQVHHLRSEYYEAAVIGDFLLNRYANVAGTRDAALIAMNSYYSLFQNATEDREFAKSRLRQVCEAMLKNWPGDVAVDPAANVLVTLALQESDIDRAIALLDTMQSNSLSRARLETVIGRLLWNEYLRISRDQDVDPQNSPVLTQAQTLMANGLAAFDEQSLTLEIAYGSLNLAQAYLEQQNVERAIEQLETARLAPLDLIKRKHASLDAGFIKDTYRTALRAYILGMRSGDQATQFVDKTQSVVTALQNELASEGGNGSQIVAIYYQLARELLDQLDRIDAPADKDSFASSLSTFMRSIQQQSTDGKVLLWIGSTMNSVADDLAEVGLDNSAKVFRMQAVEALDTASTSGFASDPQTPELTLELKRQKAIALRGQESYDAAVDLFAEVLTAKNSLLQAQIDAAVTLQLKGDQNNSATALAEAVNGVRPDSSQPNNGNIIWGWRKIVLATRGKEQFNDEFYDALYNLTYCQFRFGEIQKRRDAQEAAIDTIRTQFDQFPDMGNERNRTRFDELVRQIQGSLGQQVTGLTATDQ